MKKLLFYVSLGSLALINSYREDLPVSSNNMNSISMQAKAKDSRMFFRNKAEFQETYGLLKSKTPKELEAFVKSAGVESLRPVITEENEQQVLSAVRKRKENILIERNSTTKPSTGEKIN